MINLDHDICYRAVVSHDSRFDGVFFLAVSSTGIYCRTICSAKKPRKENCRFFSCAALAEQAGFRPCKICRPEQAPGLTPNQFGSQCVTAAVRLIEEGSLTDGQSMEKIAVELGVSSRHLRRLFQSHLGICPIQFAQTHRLLMAKRLLTETKLAMTDIALASGFKSLRRCNSAFQSVYSMTPSDFRRNQNCDAKSSQPASSIALRLAYRPPYAWDKLLKYFRGRLIPGVEAIDEESYLRSLRIGDCSGWIRITHHAPVQSLRIEVACELIPVIPVVLSLVRRAFDIDAVPWAISQVLQGDECLSNSIQSHPGLRLPGAMDNYETAIRTIIGQQVSVAAATTVMQRIVQKYGDEIATPFHGLHRATIRPERIASESVDTLAPLGLNSARASAILDLTRAILDKKIDLRCSSDPERTLAQLQELRGIGPWTANYFGMRILGWPDSFIASDLVIRKSFPHLSVKQIEARSQAWRPWRAYAVMHLWNASGFFQSSASNPIQPSRKAR